MLNSMASYITGKLIDNGTIASDDKDIYQYGFEMGFAQVINTITTLLIGFVFGMPIESIFFLLAFMTLRTYAGGYHSSSHLKCYILSTITTVAVLVCVKLIIYADIYYLPCVIGDAKAHTWPDGIFQTGYRFPNGTDHHPIDKIGWPIEFIGATLPKGLIDFEIINIIVYD